MEERGNAVALLNRILCGISEKLPMQLLYMQGGGGFSTAFARDASARIAFDFAYLEQVKEQVKRHEGMFKKELEKRDPGVRISIKPVETKEQAMATDTAETVMSLITCLPDGVFSMNRDFPGAMESCSNVGVVETYADKILVAATIRSVIESKKYYLLNKIMRLCKALGVACQVSRDLPQWDYCVDEKLLKLICEIYSDCEPHLQQGTVEAGIFCKNMPGISYVCIAPRYYNAHSPNEYFLISQSAKNVGQLRELLRRLK